MKSSFAIAAIAAIALTSASAPPALAAKNTGAFQQSAEANRLQSLCADYKLIFQINLSQMSKASKGSKAYKEARDKADNMLGTAWAAGCSWAQ